MRWSEPTTASQTFKFWLDWIWKWIKQFEKKEDDCVICIIMPTPLKKTFTADVHL